MKTRNTTKLTLTGMSTLVAAALIFACTNETAKAKPKFVEKDAPKAGLAAKIGETEVTDEELIGDAKGELHELKKREYDLRVERLNRLLEEKLIGAEAQKAGMPLEEFMEKKVIGKITTSDAEYKAFVKEKKIPDEQLKQHPEYKERITQFLENQKKQDKVQAYIANLTKKVPVEIYFKKPTMERVKLDLGDAPILGKADAPVQIVEFSDFQCPYCKGGAETMAAIKKKYGNKVAVSFKHYPLPFHTQADEASEMAMCVKKLGGSDKFFKYHDITFAAQDKLDNDSLVKNAKAAGVDEAKAKECFDKAEFREYVKKDMEYGGKVGVRSTPTFFVNGQMVAGALPIDQFSEMIDEELNAKK